MAEIEILEERILQWAGDELRFTYDGPPKLEYRIKEADGVLMFQERTMDGIEELKPYSKFIIYDSGTTNQRDNSGVLLKFGTAHVLVVLDHTQHKAQGIVVSPHPNGIHLIVGTSSKSDLMPELIYKSASIKRVPGLDLDSILVTLHFYHPALYQTDTVEYLVDVLNPKLLYTFK